MRRFAPLLLGLGLGCDTWGDCYDVTSERGRIRILGYQEEAEAEWWHRAMTFDAAVYFSLKWNGTITECEVPIVEPQS